MDSNNRNNRNGGNKKNNKNLRSVISLIGWALVLTLVFNYILAATSGGRSFEVPYSEMMDLVEQDQIKEIQLKDGVLYATPVDGYTYTEKTDNKYREPKTYTQSEKSKLTLYTTYLTDTRLLPLLDEHNVEYSSPVKSSWSVLGDILVMYILPMVLMIGLVLLVMRIVSKNGGGIGNVGKSNAKVYMEKQTGVTFKDVAGQDEAKESLEEIIDFLHNPGKYTAIGAKLPKGALLVGSPGTGKTLLAKAVAGEANVPFFSISGSEFVEMFVGMGASKVRDLFKQAKEKAPCIVFIDEIDAIGQKRNSGQLGGNDEREQTLNQLLTEMDGFEGNSGVIILAATNRPDSLDPALTRPGRFDRRVPVELPDLKGREEILKVHAKKVALAPGIDFNTVARMASGASGAELANIVNEAALRAVRAGRKSVTEADLEESIEVVIAGYQKKNSILTDKEKCIVAYHEIGHALVAALQNHSAPVQKITIIPRTSGALGYTMQVEEGNHYLMTKEELENKIATLTGGRAAEEVVFGSITTGASNDIEQATKLARAMLTRYGMSKEFDMVALETVSNQYLGGDTSLACSAQTQREIDQRVVELVKAQHEKAIKILTDNRAKLDELAKYLYEKETITGDEFMAILEEKDSSEN